MKTLIWLLSVLLISSAAYGSQNETTEAAGSCPTCAKENHNPSLQVVDACKDSIDTAAQYSFWSGWKACFCGTKNGVSETIGGLVTVFKHPIKTGKGIAHAIFNIDETAVRVGAHLKKAYESYPSLTFEQKKAVNCQVITSVGTGLVSGATAGSLAKITQNAIGSLSTAVEPIVGSATKSNYKVTLIGKAGTGTSTARAKFSAPPPKRLRLWC